jgi:hypothetical protein
MRDAEATYCVGDPWQAIYTFAGGDPLLFSKREGSWETLDRSYRLGDEDVRSAVSVLRSAGWSDEIIDKWSGSTDERSPKGRTFVLCRTRWQLKRLENRLLQMGEPYGILGRSRMLSPWERERGLAARAAVAMFDYDMPVRVDMAEALLKVWRSVGAIPKDRENPRWRDDAPIVSSDIAPMLSAPIERAMRSLAYCSYVRGAARRHGPDVLSSNPKTYLGTIHAAKGLEADDVWLLSSWGSRPARELMSKDGFMREACVAYVGVTRSRRKTITFYDDSDTGITYPFPRRSPLASARPIEVLLRPQA